MHRNNVHAAKQGVVVGAGLPREAGDAVHGTGCAGARGASPLPQSEGGLAEERVRL